MFARFCLGLVVCLSTFSVAHAEIMIPTSAGIGADARVTLGSPNTNFGSSEFFAIQNRITAPANARKTYLRFDLAALTSAAASASLQITPNNDFSVGAGVTFNLYGLNDLDAGEFWNESTITWNNAPQNDTGSNNGLIKSGPV